MCRGSTFEINQLRPQASGVRNTGQHLPLSRVRLNPPCERRLVSGTVGANASQKHADRCDQDPNLRQIPADRIHRPEGIVAPGALQPPPSPKVTTSRRAPYSNWNEKC